jgi:quinol monooxygenase YgiN
MPLIVPGTPWALGSSRRREHDGQRGDAAGAPTAIREEGGMYARSTTFTADPQRMDDGIRMVSDEIMPALQAMPGCIGVSMLVDRETGRCIVTSSWDSQEAMAATGDRVQDMRQRVMDTMGGRDMSVDEWEIGAMHRLHTPGDDACARVTWTRGDPATMEAMLDSFRMSLIPRMDDVPGFCSLSLLVDRNTGHGSLTAVYKDRRSMEDAREAVRGMREEFTGQTGMSVMDVAEFELAIHHLRVPEMA